MIRTFPKLKDAPGRYAIYARRKLRGHLFCSESWEHITLINTREHYASTTELRRVWTIVWLDGTYTDHYFEMKRALNHLLSSWVIHQKKTP